MNNGFSAKVQKAIQWEKTGFSTETVLQVLEQLNIQMKEEEGEELG